MARLYTLDASVFINAFHTDEKGSEDSRRLLELLREGSALLIEPSLLLPEAAAAVRRGTQEAGTAREFAAALAEISNLVLVPLDEPLAHEAASLAADHSLRGSDAVYGAVAMRFGSGLVTLDRQQLERLGSVLTTHRPSDIEAIGS